MISVNRLSRSTKIFIGLTIFYVALTFIVPANSIAKAAYNISDAQYYYLLFIVRLPIVALWCVVFYSYRVLHGYVQRIKDTAEGKDFILINSAMQWIAWGLPIPAIASTIISSPSNSFPDTRIASLIVTNYLYVIVSLVAFSYLASGAFHLAARSKVNLKINHIRVLIFMLVTFGVIFCYAIAHKLHGSSASDSLNSYYLPNFLVWTTIVIPYLYAWFVGIFAATQLTLVADKTNGIIYRQALQFLALGIVTIIISMCMLQYFRSIIPRTGILKIGGALVTTYGIYAIHAVGSTLLITGARRLKRIEDI